VQLSGWAVTGLVGLGIPGPIALFLVWRLKRRVVNRFRRDDDDRRRPPDDEPEQPPPPPPYTGVRPDRRSRRAKLAQVEPLDSVIPIAPRASEQQPKARQRTRTVFVETPPLPPDETHSNHFVRVKSNENDAAWSAACRKVAEAWPGSTSVLKRVEKVKDLILAGEPPDLT
jgi:hypothetical protein